MTKKATKPQTIMDQDAPEKDAPEKDTKVTDAPPPPEYPTTELQDIPFVEFEKRPVRVRARRIAVGERLEGNPLTPGDYLVEMDDGALRPVAYATFEALWKPVEKPASGNAANLDGPRWNLDVVQADAIPLELRTETGGLDIGKAIAFCNECAEAGKKVVIAGVSISRRVNR